MTSRDLKKLNTLTTQRKKRQMKGGSVHEIDEINDKNLDEILHNNNL